MVRVDVFAECFRGSYAVRRSPVLSHSRSLRRTRQRGEHSASLGTISTTVQEVQALVSSVNGALGNGGRSLRARVGARCNRREARRNGGLE